MLKRKKILISTYTFLPDIGGVATNKLTMASALLESGCEVKVVTNTECATEDDFPFEVIRSPGPRQIINIYRWADIILFSNLSIKLAWPAIFTKSRLGLCHHSSSAFDKDISKLKFTFLRNILEKAIVKKAVHFPNSVFTKKSGGEMLSKYPSHILYPIAEYEKIPDQVKDLFMEKKDAVFVGRLEEEKGILFLIDNMALIKATLCVEKLIVAGDGSLFEELKNRNIEDVEFLGAIDLKGVERVITQCSFALVPSIWEEPFGQTAVQGLALGAAVVVSDRGGLPEAVGDCAAKFNYEDPTSFEKALVEARLTRDHCESSVGYRNEYFEKVDRHLQTFNSESMAKIVLDAFEEPINKH